MAYRITEACIACGAANTLSIPINASIAEHVKTAAPSAQFPRVTANTKSIPTLASSAAFAQAHVPSVLPPTTDSVTAQV